MTTLPTQYILVIFQSDMGGRATEDTGKAFTKEQNSLSFFGEGLTTVWVISLKFNCIENGH
jgi:hypothetical protein